ncbi:MAG TPA: hypothetical protein VMT39_02655 [Candidatus Bathyarchaeia archaeon]|nr:hypothetical protein [Candidatus Bathyarchaeia archaeon]
MTTAPQTPTGELLPLNAILESAVILNWAAFGQSSQGGMVQIEYHVGLERSVEYLKIWSATSRGYLSLVCDYAVAVHRPNGAGARFANGFHSRDLGRFLDSIMMNQSLFSHDCRVSGNVVIHVRPPGEEQVALAKQRVSQALSLTAPPPRPPKVPKAAANHVSGLREANA